MFAAKKLIAARRNGQQLGQVGLVIGLAILLSLLAFSSIKAQGTLATADPDQDGLTNSQELELGLVPDDIDSDCDYIADGEEVGDVNNPTDTDGDGLIDALENNLFDSDLDRQYDHEDSTVGVQLNCGGFTPMAILNDGLDSATFTLRLGGASEVVSVTAKMSELASISYELYDDGTHGDQTAGDNIWTRAGFTSTASVSAQSQRTVLALNYVEMGLSDGSVTQFSISNRRQEWQEWNLLIISPDIVSSVVELDNHLFRTTHLLNLVDPQATLYAKNPLHFASGRLMAQRFFRDFGDDFDFLVILSDAMVRFNNAAAGNFYGVQNEVQNIGDDVYDNTEHYGSAGRLQGITFINWSMGPVLHEIMHRWTTPTLPDLGFNQCTDNVHWGAIGTGEGQMGGFDPETLVDNNDGTYSVDTFGLVANGGDAQAFNLLEQYLAGFIPISEVEDVLVPVNVDCDSFSYGGGLQTFSAEGLNTVTPAEIQTALGGERVPDHSQAQQDFRTAVVLVSQKPLSPVELAWYSWRAELLGAPTGNGFYYSFEEASNGHATMQSDLSDLKPRQKFYLPLILAEAPPAPESDNVADAVSLGQNARVSQQVSAEGDVVDVYAFPVELNASFEVSLSGEGGDADLYIYASGTEDVWTETNRLSSATPGTSTESLSGVSLETGTWYAAVFAETGTIDYTLSINVE